MTTKGEQPANREELMRDCRRDKEKLMCEWRKKKGQLSSNHKVRIPGGGQ